MSDQEGAAGCIRPNSKAMADSLSHIRAKAFRRRMTPPEARLWRCLRASKLGGFKFRRQHPIGPYILDFYCPAAGLAVEIDGAVHEHPDRLAHDRRRTAWLATQGVRVIRVPAVNVRDHLDGVLDFIQEAIRDTPSGAEPPPPDRCAIGPPHPPSRMER